MTLFVVDKTKFMILSIVGWQTFPSNCRYASNLVSATHLLHPQNHSMLNQLELLPFLVLSVVKPALLLQWKTDSQNSRTGSNPVQQINACMHFVWASFMHLTGFTWRPRSSARPWPSISNWTARYVFMKFWMGLLQKVTVRGRVTCKSEHKSHFTNGPTWISLHPFCISLPIWYRQSPFNVVEQLHVSVN